MCSAGNPVGGSIRPGNSVVTLNSNETSLIIDVWKGMRLAVLDLEYPARRLVYLLYIGTPGTYPDWWESETKKIHQSTLTPLQHLRKL